MRDVAGAVSATARIGEEFVVTAPLRITRRGRRHHTRADKRRWLRVQRYGNRMVELHADYWTVWRTYNHLYGGRLGPRPYFVFMEEKFKRRKYSKEHRDNGRTTRY